ncbi:MAG TPA: aspartate--tRNA(Asn) ligase, partial [Micromonosporaceae bacterium]|nr:aspartate--tRNA(Asn) ligase [Micromonosporaceae bacterium]
MQRILSTQLPAHVGETVTVAGWIHRRRLLKSVAFLIVRDAAGLSQVVVARPEVRDRLERLAEETVIEVVGTVVANETAPRGVELVDPSLRVLGEPAAAPPFDLYRPALNAGLATQLDHAAVSLRHPSRSAALRIAAAVVAGFRSTLDVLRFVEIHTPKVVGSATESGASVFALDYFGRRAYLAQSPQFYKQTMVGVFERVYEVGPVFRAEPHDTVRHLAEYVSLDAEFGFITDHRDVLLVLREAIAGMLSSVATRAGAAVERLGLTLPEIPAEVPLLHFSEALTIAGASPDEPDLSPADERAVGEWGRREHGSDFVAVEGYPMVKRPFY